MKRQVYTLGVKEGQGKNVPLVFDYDTNEYIHTSPMNHDRIVSEFDVKEVMLYCYIDGIVRILDRSFNTIGEVEKLSEVFNTDVRFVRVFAYNGFVDHDNDDDKCFTVVTYNPNSNYGADVSDYDKMIENYMAVNDITHYIAMNNNEDYLANSDEYFIPIPESDDYIGDSAYVNCDITSLLEENITNVLTEDDDDDDLVVYPSDGTTLTFKLLDDDIYVQLNSFYKEHDRFFVPFLKLPINMANELNNIVNWSID